jgi:predicted GNAT superfamily acetyltransferase
LKLHQREFALEEQLQLVKWTFDPLQSRNAYLNLHKLGGIIRSFRPDYFGNLGGTMNQAFPTDRFWVEWYVGSSHVANRLAGHFPHLSSDQLSLVNTVEGPTEERRCTSFRVDHREARLLVEIPTNISQLRLGNPALAGQWQTACRKIFSTYLSHYIIADSFREENRAFYLLVRATLSQVLDDSV